MVRTPGMLGNDVWNEQNVEGGNVLLNLRGLWGVNSTNAADFLKDQNKQQAVTEAFGLVVSKSENMWKLSLYARPLPDPNTRLLFKHVSLTQQLMKHKEPWIPSVSHFKTYRIIRKNLSWQNSSWLTLVSRPPLFSISVCCRHSNCKAQHTGPGCHFLKYLGCHTEIALWTQQYLFLSCCAVVPQRSKL